MFYLLFGFNGSFKWTSLFLIDSFEQIPQDKKNKFLKWLLKEESKLSVILCGDSNSKIELDWLNVKVSVDENLIRIITRHLSREKSELVLERVFKTRRKHLYQLVKDNNPYGYSPRTEAKTYTCSCGDDSTKGTHSP